MSFRYADQERHPILKVKIYLRQVLRMIPRQLHSWRVLDSRNLQMYQPVRRHPIVLWISSLRSNYTVTKTLILKLSKYSSLQILNNKSPIRKCFKIFLNRRNMTLLLFQMMNRVWKRICVRIKILFLQEERFGKNITVLYLLIKRKKKLNIKLFQALRNKWTNANLKKLIQKVLRNWWLIKSNKILTSNLQMKSQNQLFQI